MKLRRLIEYGIRAIFLEKSHTKFGGETIRRLFPQSAYLWIKFKNLNILRTKKAFKMK